MIPVYRMGFKDVPDRWEDYTNLGNVIKGTRYSTLGQEQTLGQVQYNGWGGGV